MKFNIELFDQRQGGYAFILPVNWIKFNNSHAQYDNQLEQKK